MMVGGDVIEVLALPEKVYINCKDLDYWDDCAIYVERTAEANRVKPGDVIWWQGQFAYWTPASNRVGNKEKCGVDYDIKIPRIGYSGVGHPLKRPSAVVPRSHERGIKRRTG